MILHRPMILSCFFKYYTQCVSVFIILHRGNFQFQTQSPENFFTNQNISLIHSFPPRFEISHHRRNISTLLTPQTTSKTTSRTLPQLSSCHPHLQGDHLVTLPILLHPPIILYPPVQQQRGPGGRGSRR